MMHVPKREAKSCPGRSALPVATDKSEQAGAPMVKLSY